MDEKKQYEEPIMDIVVIYDNPVRTDGDFAPLGSSGSFIDEPVTGNPGESEFDFDK